MMMSASTTSSETTASLRWSAVLAGSVVAIGMMALLYSMGLALGLSSVDVDAHGRLHTVGLFAGVWGALVPLVSLFVGGWIACRASGAGSFAAATLHGMVLWGLTAISLVWLLGATVGGVVSGAASLGRDAAKLGGQALSSGAGALGELGEAAGRLGSQATEDFSLDADAALRPVNARLLASGRAPISTEQLERSSRTALRGILRTGKLDRPLLVESIVKETSVSREDADGIADAIEAQVDHAREALTAARESARDTLERARTEGMAKLRDVAGDAAARVATLFWGLFAALGLGLVAAVGGSLAAVQARRA